MKALLKYDWYKSGIKLLMVTVFLFLLIIIFYGLGIYSHLSMLKGRQSGYNVSMEFYDSRMLPIWGLPLVTAWISGRMMTDDEQCGWHKSCMAMPMTHFQYVTEKYLFGLAFMGSSMLFVLLCQTVYVVRIGVFDLWFLTLFFLRYIMVFLTVSAICTVLSFWKSFGFALFCEVFLLFAVPAVWMIAAVIFDVTRPSPSSANLVMNSFAQAGNFVNWLYNSSHGIVIGSIGSVLLYVLSYLLCLKIAQKKTADV